MPSSVRLAKDFDIEVGVNGEIRITFLLANGEEIVMAGISPLQAEQLVRQLRENVLN